MDATAYVVMAYMEYDDAYSTVVGVYLSQGAALGAAAKLRLAAAKNRELVNTYVVLEAPLKG